MCVAITMEPGSELTAEEVFKMGRANADGFGIAWAEEGQVYWWKTINYNPEYVAKIINERKGFFRLAHFRLSTVGGTRADLCHPFEVGPLANAAPMGHSWKVLIHNGHWNRWTDVADILKKEGGLPDTGPWSDSRLAAMLASYDEEWLQTVTGRVATLDGDGNIMRLGSWESLREGIKVSNKIWDHNFNYSRRGRDRDWPGWGWNEENWKEWERHQKEQDEKARKEIYGKEGKETTTGGQKAGSVHVGAGPSYTGVHTKATPEGGAGNGHNSTSRRGTGAGNEEAAQRPSDRVQYRYGEVHYDHTPWQNPHTKRWYYISPESIAGRNYRIEEISADKARQLLEQAAATVDEV